MFKVKYDQQIHFILQFFRIGSTLYDKLQVRATGYIFHCKTYPYFIFFLKTELITEAEYNAAYNNPDRSAAITNKKINEA